MRRLPADLRLGQPAIVGLPRSEIDWRVFDQRFEQQSHAPRVRMEIELPTGSDHLEGWIALSQLAQLLGADERGRLRLDRG